MGLRRSQTDSIPMTAAKNKIPIGDAAVSLVDTYSSGKDAIPRVNPQTVKLMQSQK
jgi:hypothetical protein